MRAHGVGIGIWRSTARTLSMLSLATQVGCSGDLLDVSLDDASSGGDPTGSDAEPAGSSAGLDESGDGTGGEDSGQPENWPCEIDCGEGGVCEWDDDGAPYCVCVEGYAAYGLRCLPCSASDGQFDVDIPRVAVSAEFLLGGEPFVSSIYEHAAIVLVDPATHDRIELGNTADGGTVAPVAVIPGTYEVHYARLGGGLRVPANTSAKVDTVSIPDTESFTLVVDVPAVELEGRFTINGAPPPTGQYENGALVLLDPATGDEVDLGDTRDGEYRAMVVPGLYHVHYRRRLATNQAPLNADARVISTVEIFAADDPQLLDVDVPVTTLAGALTLDGATPPDGTYENGRILLRDRLTGDRIVLGQTRDGAYEAPLVPGDYEVIYERMLGGQQVPVNRAAVLQQVTLQAGEQSLDIDIATAVISGGLTVAGAPAPADPGDDGVIVLRNPDTGDEATLGNTAEGTYTRRVVQGDYDVYYRQQTSSGGVPANTNAPLGNITVSGGATFDVDVPMVTVSASVTVRGQPPPDSAYDDGLLYLRDPKTGDSVLLGNTRRITLERPVVPGTYELHYVVEAAGPTMPVNARSRLDTLEIGPTTELVVDIPVVDLQGEITVAGELPPQTQYDRAALSLYDVATADPIYLGAIDSGVVRRSLTAGTYVITYRSLLSNGLVPANLNAGLGCIELTP
ncbi:MAG: hypothetical protein AAGF11_27050 [Myxococcota bacterium]